MYKQTVAERENFHLLQTLILSTPHNMWGQFALCSFFLIPMLSEQAQLTSELG